MVIITLPAEGDFSKLFFQGVEECALPQIFFLPPVQNDGTKFHMLLTIREQMASSSA